MKPRVMLDTGALIALERGDQQLRKVHRLATDHGYQIVGITPVIAAWWRRGKREKQRIQILRTLVIEPPDLHVDALVMAAASLRCDTVYTSDLGDLERLLEVFPSVELAAV
ncbi:MAG: hypothetical protein E6J91_43165 [Deltaproteobacteria bacterium]|nr:MAG: hypothetical protein E6J91_43165 [Deltaproteobacteria bacterium]